MPQDIYQTAKVAKILLLLEKGKGEQFKGKTLSEIELEQDIYHSSESDDNTDDIDDSIPLSERILQSIENKDIQNSSQTEHGNKKLNIIQVYYSTVNFSQKIFISETAINTETTLFSYTKECPSSNNVKENKMDLNIQEKKSNKEKKSVNKSISHKSKQNEENNGKALNYQHATACSL